MILSFFIVGSIQLVPDGSILIHILLVLLMVAVLNRTLFVPINRVLSERHRKGMETVRECRVIERRVEDEERRYLDALRSARTSGYKLMQEMRSSELREREKELEALRSEIAERIFRERGSIQGQAEEARDGFDAAGLGTMIRNRVLRGMENRRRLD